MYKLILVSFLLTLSLVGNSCYDEKLFPKDDKVIYFDYMSDLEEDGRMTFRLRTTLEDIENNIKNKRYDTYERYYKVYHNCMPYRVDQYRGQTQKLELTYCFDKNATNNKIRKYNINEYIDCDEKYSKLNNNVRIQIENCTDGSQKIVYIETHENMKKYQYYYQDNELYKKEIDEHNMTDCLRYHSRYEYGELVFQKKVGDICGDYLPVSIHPLGKYPWCKIDKDD